MSRVSRVGGFSRTGRRIAVLAALALLGGCGASPAASPGESGTGGNQSGAPTAGASASGQPSAGASGSPGASGAPGASGVSCAAAAAGMPLDVRVGQLLVSPVQDTLDQAEASAITEAHVGSVILMGKSSRGVAATRAITDEVQGLGVPGSPAGPVETLVTVDQEGGLVVRLSGPGFDPMPSAAEQARLSDAELTRRATRWAQQLKAAGVHLDLAPVADIVPAAKASSNEPVGKLGRGYGSDARVVADKVGVFVRAFRGAGLGSTAKHFPGLGEVTGNTDFAARVVDPVTSAGDGRDAGFRSAVAAGVDSVMVSTAVYPRIDPDNPAAFSPAVVALVRDRLGFDGVISSDDLGVAKVMEGVPAAERGVRFVRAGGDLAISVDAAVTRQMASGLVKAAQGDPAFERRVTDSTGRVLALKARYGLVRCGA